MSSTPANIGVLQKQFTYADAGTAVEIGYLPPNSYVLGIQVGIEVAFNGDTTNTLDVGITGTAANFADNVALGTIANASVTLLNSGEVQSATASTKIIGTVVSTGSASAGKARVTVTYVQL